MTQQIQGDGNTQVGHVAGDFHVHDAGPVDTSRLVACEHCQQLISPLSTECRGCGLDLDRLSDMKRVKATKPIWLLLAISAMLGSYAIGEGMFQLDEVDVFSKAIISTVWMFMFAFGLHATRKLLEPYRDRRR